MPKKSEFKVQQNFFYTIAKFIDYNFRIICRWRRKYFQWVADTKEKQKKRKYVMMGEKRAIQIRKGKNVRRIIFCTSNHHEYLNL